MAEAHQGVAFSFAVTEDEGLHLNVSLEAIKAVWLSGYRSWRKRWARLVNQILNGLFPSHPYRGLAVIAIVTGLRRYKHFDIPAQNGILTFVSDKIPRNWFSVDTRDIISCFLVSGTAWLGTIAIRKYTLQALFSYHGWMYAVRSEKKNKSIFDLTKLWYALVHAIIGRKPSLYSFQGSMPFLPVPALKDTVDRHLRTVRPLLDDENYERLKKSGIEFERGVGRRLQRYLWFKSFVTSNYVSDWWEEYVYLRGRSPIIVNSNFYAMDCINISATTVQAARAANIIVALLGYRRELDNQTLMPTLIQNSVPLCSRQYDRQFNTTRIPGEITDQLVHYIDSKHIAVYCNGKWYKLFVYHNSQPLNAREVEIQIQKILDDTSVSCCDSERYLGALTAGDRIPWAQARKKHFNTGCNKTSLAAIEKAAFTVILEDEEYGYKYDNEKRLLDKFGRSMLHGKGYDRWFDKSFNLIITKDCKAGLNTEHSWADAPVTAHMWEYCVADDYFKLKYDEKTGHTIGTARSGLPTPQKLKWQFNDELDASIRTSLSTADALLNDVDLYVHVFDDFGKGIMKKAKVSPDAFIQMSFQLAYFRDIGRHHLTYEASMTRLFREGRTETIRSCSIESTEWVKSMMDETVSDEVRFQKFKAAAEYHVLQTRDCMTGKGVDRHLFCLYVVSKYLEIDIPFLKEVLGEPWRLSTSQTPTSQTNKLDLDKNPEYLPGGGGFGPVADDGYGVSYMIMGENRIIFHISSKKSSDNTDSYRFGQEIKKALNDIKTMFESYNKKKSSALESAKKDDN